MTHFHIGQGHDQNFCGIKNSKHLKASKFLTIQRLENLTLTFKFDLRVNMRCYILYCEKTRIWKQNCKISDSFGVIKGCTYVRTDGRTDQVFLRGTSFLRITLKHLVCTDQILMKILEGMDRYCHLYEPNLTKATYWKLTKRSLKDLYWILLKEGSQNSNNALNFQEIILTT